MFHMTQGEARKAAGRVLPDVADDFGWETYRRWGVGPLMTREQWTADQELLHSDWPAWRKRHGV
jgi:hypothetical protein